MDQLTNQVLIELMKQLAAKYGLFSSTFLGFLKIASAIAIQANAHFVIGLVSYLNSSLFKQLLHRS